MSADPMTWRNALSARHLPFVDELKGVAILLIVAFHAQLALGWTNWTQGQIGVDIFLILSGWMIGRSLKPDSSLGDFFRRRVWRIVPAYWVVLLVICVARQMKTDAPFDWSSCIAHLFGLHIFGPSEWFFSINASFWFISLLLVVYPLAFVLRRVRSGSTILCVGMALAIVAYWLGYLAQREAVVVNIPARMISFCAGLALAAALSGPADLGKHRGLFFALFAICGYMELTGATLLRPLLYAVPLGVVYVVLRGGVSGRVPCPRWCGLLAFLGGISYEVFLLHQPLLRLGVNVWPLEQYAWGREISALLGIVICIPAAWMLNRALGVLFFRPGNAKPKPPAAAQP